MEESGRGAAQQTAEVEREESTRSKYVNHYLLASQSGIFILFVERALSHLSRNNSEIFPKGFVQQKSLYVRGKIAFFL